MLEAIDIPIENLILDPNNPRFVCGLEEIAVVPDSELVSTDDATLKKFSWEATQDTEDVTNIRNLYLSMLQIGFVAIDRVVVRKIEDTDKYLVIEGNRRISTVKKIKNKLKAGSDVTDDERKKIEANLSSFKVMPCKLLSTEGLSKEEREHRISVILGLRHHGSLLEWGALPRAYSIYREYMATHGGTSNEFVQDNLVEKAVSACLSISAAEVKSALKTYIAYLQIGELETAVKSKHYSLIQAGVSNKTLASYYFEIDPKTYQLTDESVQKMIEICQFDTRDSNQGDNILNDPKDFAKFGKLVRMKVKESHDESKRYIKSQMLQVLDEESPKSLDNALDDVKDYINRKKWVEAILALLTAQQKGLSLDDYTGTSNDLAAKNELKAPLRKIRLLASSES